MDPLVSFVVPCYKLAQLLPECVHSILTQTYGNFEVLIMDDCSPDDTPAVARAFHDPRVRHIRNEHNLGHLANYNRGIAAAAGKYVWLISADDKLRRPHVLQQYVEAMEKNPRAGFACCPAVEIRNGVESKLANYSAVADHDAIFDGHQFLARFLLQGNCVIAASGMVRKTCYDALGGFPPDFPYAGDWYLWCLFALHHDVAYFAEPMVNYRQHEQSMTSGLMAERIRVCVEDDIGVLWRIKQQAEAAGQPRLARRCRIAIAYNYAVHMMGERYQGPGGTLSPEACQASLRRFAGNPREEQWIAARIAAFRGDAQYRRNQSRAALDSYREGLQQAPWMMRVRVKAWLLRTGWVGSAVRRQAFALRQAGRRLGSGGRTSHD